MSTLPIDLSSPFMLPPKNRSSLRLQVGKFVFCQKRYIYWFLNRKTFAREKNAKKLPFLVFSHKTPLLRPLGEDIMPLQHNKIKNLQIAVPRINGIILEPGKTFSFWRLVGKPTRSKGYVEGIVLHNGKYYPGIGGGLCQLSNLIYWLTLHTPLTVIERWRHNYDVFPDYNRTQPFGSGATVVYNYVDLQIRNDTTDKYQLILWLDDNYLNGSWYSSGKPLLNYKVYESEHRITSQWWGGYIRHNVLKRKIFDSTGQLIDDEFVCSNEAVMMYDPLLPAD